MVGELAGRDVDGFADAGAGGLDAGETYGFQFGFSLEHVRRKSRVRDKALTYQFGWKMKNHQPRLREVAWCCIVAKNFWSGLISRASIGAGNSHGGNERRNGQGRTGVRVVAGVVHDVE
jgi:hypothetical protein